MLADYLRYCYANDDPNVKSRLKMGFEIFKKEFLYVYNPTSWPSILTSEAVFKDDSWPFRYEEIC